MADLTFAEPLNMLDESDYVPWVKSIFGSLKYRTGIRAVKMLSGFNKWLLEEMLFRLPSLQEKQMVHWRYTADRVDRRLAKELDRPDFFTHILERSQGPDALSRQEMYAISSLFMIAGTETTATALSGTLYYLLTNPRYMKSLQEELRRAFSGMDDLKLELLARLPILEATIKEGIRMYPPVPIGFPRVSPPGGMMVGEHFVPEGTQLAIHHLSTYRQNSNFNRAYEFRPERWMGDAKFRDDQLDAFEPFIVGPRNCLGQVSECLPGYLLDVAC